MLCIDFIESSIFSVANVGLCGGMEMLSEVCKDKTTFFFYTVSYTL